MATIIGYEQKIFSSHVISLDVNCVIIIREGIKRFRNSEMVSFNVI